MLKSAADGARDAGAEVEYIDLYDLNFTGCRSCMLCKRKDVERCHCYWKDDLSPVIDKIFQADALIIGTPIYLGRPTSRYFALIERLHFCSLSYDDYSNYFKGKVNVGFFVTMNATKEFYDRLYKEKFEAYAKEMEMLGGEVNLYPFYAIIPGFLGLIIPAEHLLWHGVILVSAPAFSGLSRPCCTFRVLCLAWFRVSCGAFRPC